MTHTLKLDKVSSRTYPLNLLFSSFWWAHVIQLSCNHSDCNVLDALHIKKFTSSVTPSPIFNELLLAAHQPLLLSMNPILSWDWVFKLSISKIGANLLPTLPTNDFQISFPIDSTIDIDA